MRERMRGPKVVGKRAVMSSESSFELWLDMT